jgi:hypothetical protein
MWKRDQIRRRFYEYLYYSVGRLLEAGYWGLVFFYVAGGLIHLLLIFA